MLRRRVSLALLVLGLGLLAQGSWIFSKALLAQVLLRRAWAAARAGDERPRPWPWADTWPVARLLSPARGVDLIVLEGATGSSIAFGPGHIQGSAPPGAAGNVAFAGHRDTHFRFLERLEPGEPLWLELPNGVVQRYEVQSESIVDEHDTRLLQAQGQWLTLVTCYPFDAPLAGGPLRYVVRASPVEAARLALRFETISYETNPDSAGRRDRRSAGGGRPLAAAASAPSSCAVSLRAPCMRHSSCVLARPTRPGLTSAPRSTRVIGPTRKRPCTLRDSLPSAMIRRALLKTAAPVTPLESGLVHQRAELIPIRQTQRAIRQERPLDQQLKCPACMEAGVRGSRWASFSAHRSLVSGGHSRTKECEVASWLAPAGSPL